MSRLFRVFDYNFRFPSIADLKLGDIYMIVNFFFVFGTLIEFAIINAQSTSARKKADKARLIASTSVLGNGARGFDFTVSAKVDPGMSEHNYDNRSDSTENVETEISTSQQKNEEEKQKDLDDISKGVFIATFVIWNIVYFVFGFNFKDV